MTIGQPERVTQNRVLALFGKELGYRLLGNWTRAIAFKCHDFPFA
jgi:hypothetical protein